MKGSRHRAAHVRVDLLVGADVRPRADFGLDECGERFLGEQSSGEPQEAPQSDAVALIGLDTTDLVADVAVRRLLEEDLFAGVVGSLRSER